VSSQIHRVWLDEQSVRPIDERTPLLRRRIGHSFKVVIEVEGIADLTLEWYEKTKKPYHPKMEAGKWVDMFQLDASSSVFRPWMNHLLWTPTESVAFTLEDPPSIVSEDSGQASDRTLHFDIRVRDRVGNLRQIRAHQYLSLNPRIHGSEVMTFKIESNNQSGFGLGQPF